MRVVQALLALLLAAGSAQAQDRSGRVDAVYVEAANGVLIEERLAGSPAGARWEDVDLGERKVLARVPDDLRVARGDLISVRVGAPKSSQLAYVLPTTTVSRALAPDPNASIGR